MPSRKPDIRLSCAGCGAQPLSPYPFRCPNAGRDDTDHLITRHLDPADLRWPAGDEPNPFIRYRRLLCSYQLARAGGMSEADYVSLVEELDRAVAQVDGRRFRATPFRHSSALGAWVKDETGNVSGSHKARHLMGLLILLEVGERTGAFPADRPSLAIASCGNAALAAAVVARAGARKLEVFVPTWADPKVVERLRALGAMVVPCPRQDGVPGDPTYLRLQEAVRAGALPFTCQGPDNGLTIEGGLTLGYEMVSQLQQHGAAIDRLFIQVGGGALASACIQAFREAVALGALRSMPRIQAVQASGGYPLVRAHGRVARRILERLRAEPELGGTARGAALMISFPGEVGEELRYAATHRSSFMWPWEEEPKSIAHGILDDETYDWLEVVRGMIQSGGYPVLASEEILKEANALGRATTGIGVDATGSAGLAGLLQLRRSAEVGAEEQVAVLFTGASR